LGWKEDEGRGNVHDRDIRIDGIVKDTGMNVFQVVEAAKDRKGLLFFI